MCSEISRLSTFWKVGSSGSGGGMVMSFEED